MKIIAVTGGIGSGKSTFSEQATKKGFKLLDSDAEVSKLYKKPSADFIQFLKKVGLGESVKNKKINKSKISNIIFSNVIIKTKLENYIFKIIRKNRQRFILTQKQRKTKIVFLDIPLLFENNLQNEFDTIISIITKRKIRYQRLKKSKKMTKNMFKKIIKHQTSDVVRRNKSDIVITNNTSLKSFIKKTNKLIDNLIT
tara:strand:- start:199 stop:792 length:594 start_codon:yes stop_codon:yes gene_type:complete